MERVVLKKLVINRPHLNDLRHRARMMGCEKQLLMVVSALEKKARAGALPNGDWYRRISHPDGSTAGYVVGRGVLVASNLAEGMVPRGVRV